MKTVCIIGAGNIGSRHLQGIKKVTFPLTIEVVDPSLESLKIAEERYNQIETSTKHKVSFTRSLHVSKKIDLAIIATSSNVRRDVTEKLLSNTMVEFLILEKILFQKKKDYFEIEKLLKKKNIKTWVNFSMRTMPFYNDLKEKVKGSINMVVSGSQYGLITNAIHFADYIAYLTHCYDFKIVTDGLDPSPIESKRKGFLELNGSLTAYFNDGSLGTFTCYSSSDAPIVVEVTSSNYHCISKESEKKAYISSAEDEWRWKEIDSNIPYQSAMTNLVVEKILKSGDCSLTKYQDASKIHIQLLDPLLYFLNKNPHRKSDLYPFT